MDTRLETFVYESLRARVSRDEIAVTAKKHGRWSEAEIAAALDAYAEAPTYHARVPVPKRLEKQDSDGFFYFGRFSACYACLWALMDLVSAVINGLVPDPSGLTGSYAHETRWSVAVMTVVLPLYIRMLYVNGRMLAKDPLGWSSPWRRFFFGLTRYAAVATGAVAAVRCVVEFLKSESNANDCIQLAAAIVICAILYLDYRSPLQPPVGVRSFKRDFRSLAMAVTLTFYATGLISALEHREPPRDQVPMPAPAEPPHP